MRHEIQKALARYYETITGELLELRLAVGGEQARLPLFLRNLYELFEGCLFGQSCLLAVLSAGTESPTPGEYAAHARSMRDRAGRPVVLVLNILPSYERNRLVRAGVDFIVPGRQLFLPALRVDLREHSRPRPEESAGQFMPATQAFLIYHLNRNSALAGAPLRVQAHEMGYSPMTMTTVKRELQNAGLCEAERAGRATPIRFLLQGPALWEAVQNRLVSPVRQTLWSEGMPAAPDRPLVAGLSALEEVTELADDPTPTFALYRSRGAAGWPACPQRSRESATDVRVEWWRYDPWKLTRNGHSVDAFSLYLSLRHSLDERVQQALGHLAQTFPWEE